jgi:hypothetical protein
MPIGSRSCAAMRRGAPLARDMDRSGVAGADEAPFARSQVEHAVEQAEELLARRVEREPPVELPGDFAGGSSRYPGGSSMSRTRNELRSGVRTRLTAIDSRLAATPWPTTSSTYIAM